MGEVPINTWTTPTAPKGGSGKPNVIQGITPETWFSPLMPLPDFAPQDVAGRQWDYPVGYNLLINPRPLEKITFKILRQTAKRCDIMKTIINYRLDQLEAREWVIKPVDDAGPETKSKNKKVAIKDPRITEMTKFWRMPDQVNTWDQWLRPWMRDHFEIDAASAYIRRNRGGGIYGVEVMDGSTIKINIDQNGRRPQPPSPAFSQILKGVPAISYTTDQLIYSVRNLRTGDVYGSSAVEDTIVTINAAINRALFNQNYYTEGNVPDAIGSLPENFTPAQAAQFTEWWDSMYAGNLANKRKVKFVPGMSHFQQLKDPEMKNEYDDYIARVLCCRMGMSPQPFIKSMNRASSETQKEGADEVGAAPTENMIKDFVNKIIQGPQFFNYPDLEFDWAEKEDQDPNQQMVILTGYVKDGILSPNEARERIGEEADPNGDDLGIVTPTGFITMDQSKQLADANIKKANTPPPAPVMAGGGNGSDASQGEPKSTTPPPKKKPTTPTVKSELSSSDISTDSDPTDSDDLKKKSKTLISLKRKSIVDAQAALVPVIYKVLRKTANSVHKQLEEKLDKGMAKAVDINLDDMEGLDDATKEQLQSIANEAGVIQLAHLGLSNDGITGQLDTRVTSWVEERGAQLVSLVQDSTKEELQRIISQGLQDNIGRQAIIDEIMGTTDEGSYVFSEDRAALIAQTELGNANSQGALLGMKEAEAAGVNVKKEWDTDGDACPICQANEDQGPIDLDDEFDSGDDAPLAHVNCYCVLNSVTSD